MALAVFATLLVITLLMVRTWTLPFLHASLLVFIGE